jgi:hypothetical protein
MQLADDLVLIVSGIADDGPAIARSREVVAVTGSQGTAFQESQVALVSVGVIGRSFAIDRVEVEARGTEVDKGVRVVLPLETGDGIERDVMVDELAKVGVARRQAELTVWELARVLIVVFKAQRFVQDSLAILGFDSLNHGRSQHDQACFLTLKHR